jgi:hypothetical protein
MAIDSAGSVAYFLLLPLEHKDYLGAVRHWENLKVGVEEGVIWVKDLTTVQIDSVEIKSIPHKTLYYTSGPSLYKQGSLLPDRAIPSLLWTPVARGLPIELPPYNHNYFGVNERIAVRLVSTDQEQEAYAMLASMEALQAYVQSAPAIRLKHIRWVIANEKSLLLGTPLLPIQGDVYWRLNDFLLPAGCQFEFPLLAETIQALLNPKGDHWIVWQTDGRYWKLAKEDVRPLSIASFRESIKN